MTAEVATRREFLATVGALTATSIAAPRLVHGGDVSEPGLARETTTRGLAPSPDDFLLAPGLTYLQTGSLGPTPRPVMEASIAAWRLLESDPAGQGYGPMERAMEEVRSKAAAFIGCKTEELVLTNCTTEGMNWVAQGLGLVAGDRILTTDQEHPGGRVCWDYAVRRFGAGLDVVEIPPGEGDAQAIIDRFARAITPKTRVLSFSHVLSSTGLRMPVAALSALARSRGCLSVVDGAQAAGGIAVDVKGLGCDAYATSGHKWMLAPKGTGLLYLSEAMGTAIDPIALQSGRAAYSASSGVSSLPSVLGLGAAIDYLNRIGMARIEAHNLALRQRVHDGVARIPALRVVGGSGGALATPLLSYRLPEGLTSGALHRRLRDRHGVEVKVVPSHWFNGHRISTHLFNTPGDVEALIHALESELA